jgi:hypothetical protein
MCRVVETVLIDQETIYARRHGNDRLPLGLKGSLNEYELDLLRQRSLSVRYEKVRRGELIVSTPVGFVKAGDRYEKDPDRRVQEAIGLVFAKVLEHDQRSDRVAPAPSAPTIGRKCWLAYWTRTRSCNGRTHGAASEVTPKFVSPSDPAAQWTGPMRGPAFFAYADNYLIDVKFGIIVDV